MRPHSLAAVAAAHLLLLLLPQTSTAEERSLAEYRRELQNGYWPDRYRAVEALGKSGSPGAARILADALKDKEPYVRLRAVQSLGEIGSAAAEKELRTALQDSKAVVRRAAVEELAKITDRRDRAAADAARREQEEAASTSRALRALENSMEQLSLARLARVACEYSSWTIGILTLKP